MFPQKVQAKNDIYEQPNKNFPLSSILSYFENLQICNLKKKIIILMHYKRIFSNRSME